MSQRDVEILREAYAAYNQAFDDADPIRALTGVFRRYLDPRIEWINEPESPDRATTRGIENVMRWFESGLEVWESVRQVPEEFRKVGDKVVVLVRTRAKERGSGVELSEPWAHVCTLRDGRIIRLEQFRNREQALKAAGPDC
ncbi:MAG: nuclear transport factor 2 family protein [Solirubrobacterales bacterium]